MDTQWRIFLAIFALFTIGIASLCFYLVHRTRCRMRKIDNYSAIISEELKKKGVDKYYYSMETADLIAEYRKLLNDYFDHKSDLKYIADIGCRTKFIEDIFVERKVSIPEFNVEKLG